VVGRRLQRGKGKGKDWVEKELGLTAQEVVRKSPRRGGHGMCGSKREKRSTGRGSGSSYPSLRLQGCGETLGGGANVFVDRQEPQDEQEDYERLPESSEAFIYLAMTRLMVRRLARS
jgi:hypothetical protein